MPRGIKELMKDHCKVEENRIEMLESLLNAVEGAGGCYQRFFEGVVEENRIEMLESLLNAVEGAGGCYQRFFEGVVEEDMTVAELIDTLAQNNVRFVYVGDKK